MAKIRIQIHGRVSGSRMMRLLGGSLMVALVVVFAACGDDHPTGPGPAPTPRPSPTPGPCHVVCSAYSSWYYLAIALSPSTHSCATASNYENAEVAKRVAVDWCARYGASDCRAIVWGRKGVAAVAVNHVAYGWGWAAVSSDVAQEKAVAHCESRTP